MAAGLVRAARVARPQAALGNRHAAAAAGVHTTGHCLRLPTADELATFTDLQQEAMELLDDAEDSLGTVEYNTDKADAEVVVEQLQQMAHGLLTEASGAAEEAEVDTLVRKPLQVVLDFKEKLDVAEQDD